MYLQNTHNNCCQPIPSIYNHLDYKTTKASIRKGVGVLQEYLQKSCEAPSLTSHLRNIYQLLNTACMYHKDENLHLGAGQSMHVGSVDDSCVIHENKQRGLASDK